MLGTTCYTQSNLFTNMVNLEIWSLSTHLFSSILQSHKRIIPIRQFMSTESYVINNNNNDNKQIPLNHWIPPTLLPNMARQKDGRKGDPDVVSAGLSAAQQAGETATCHLEREAAADLLRETARWSGWPCLRSAQLLLALIFNRCAGARPAKSLHMLERGKSKQRHTHTQTGLCVLNHCH